MSETEPVMECSLCHARTDEPGFDAGAHYASHLGHWRWIEVSA